MGWGTAHPEGSRRLLPYAALRHCRGLSRGLCPLTRAFAGGPPGHRGISCLGCLLPATGQQPCSFLPRPRGFPQSQGRYF